MSRRHHARLALALSAVAVLACACSSSSAGSPETPLSGLAAAMSTVHGDGPASTYFEYGDFKQLRELGLMSGDPLHDRSRPMFDPRWANVAGLGAGALYTNGPVLADPTGINVYGADTAVRIGDPPHTAIRLTGAMDAATITDRFTAMGATPRSFGGTKGLTTGDDNQVNLGGAVTKATHTVNELNQIVVTHDQLAVSPDSDSLQAVLNSGGRSLLDTGSYRDVADCLGNVLAAVILTPKKASNAAIVAVGVRTPTSATAPVAEVLCVVPAVGKQSEVRAALASALALTAHDPLTDVPNSQYFSDAQVDTPRSLVRSQLTVTADTSVGHLIQGVQRGMDGYWVGTCSVADVARHSC